MISNEIIANTHDTIVILLPLTRNVFVYKQSISCFHNQLSSLYKLLQLSENRDLNSAEILDFQKFNSMAANFSNILTYFQNCIVKSIIAFPLHNIFFKIDELQKITAKLSIILSGKDSKIDFNNEVNFQNQMADLQHIKIILMAVQKFGALFSNFPDIEQIVSFHLDFINTYFEKHYNEVNSILSNLNISSSIPNTEIKQIKKELSTFKSINMTIDDIQTMNKLNSGFFSTLYCSTRLATGELLTVKEVNFDQMDRVTWVSAYSKLYQLCYIRHPFILDVVGIHFCEPYRIITRFFKGKSLFELIHNYSDDTKSALLNISSPQESKISLTGCQLTKIAYQIANGMMFLHSNGIVHCDLTSSNVLLDDLGVVKIANFGLSGLVCSFNNKNENDILSFKRNSYRLIGKPGNPGYLAPEVLEKNKIGSKADVYSYGIILWEMLMKKIPFDGMSYQSIYDYTVRKNKRLLINVPASDELIKLINLCLSSNPHDRPDFIDIVNLFEGGKIAFELNSTSEQVRNDLKLGKKELSEDSYSKILLNYEYIEKILKDPSSNKFPYLVKFLIKNMTFEMHEMIRSIYLISTKSVSSSSFSSLFLSFANCLNFDSLVLLASRIINPEEYPSFIKLCGMNIIHSLSSFSSISLIASFAEFFSTVPDNCFDMISEYIPQLVDQILSPTTLAKISFSTLSETDFDIVFYIFHFIARLDHIKYLQNHKMQIYLFFSCEMIESINKQSDIDSFSRVLPLIEEYLTYEQTNSIIQLIEKDLIVPFSIFEFLLKKVNKEAMSKVILILLKTALKRDIESSLFDLLHILAVDDFECLLTDIDEVFEILQIMIVEKISLNVAFFVLFQLSKLSSIRNYILNTFQFQILDLILDSNECFEMKFSIFSELYSNEFFCSEMQKNEITTRIIDIILKSFQDTSESSIKSILSFILALSSHQMGCQLLNDEDLLQPFSQIFFLASQKDLNLSLKILINLTNARIEIPQPSLIVSCLMNDLLYSGFDIHPILIALRNIISISSTQCVQEFDLQHSILPLLSVDFDHKVIILVLQLFSVCEILVLKNLFVQIVEKISCLLASSSKFPDIVLSSINILNAISSQYNLKPFLDQLKLIEVIDFLIKSLKEDYPKVADQLVNLKNRLTS